MAITKKDIGILKDMAKKQLEYANTPENKKREAAWYAHNDLKSDIPMVTIEEWTFHHEVARAYSCETEEGRSFEGQLLGNITAREDIDDDRATPDFYAVYRNTWFRPFGVDSQSRYIEGSSAHEFIPVINDLEADCHRFKASDWGFDFNKEYLEQAQEIFSEIMPVVQLTSGPGAGLSYMLTSRMTLETMLVSIIDYPELFHKYISQLADDCAEYLRELENAGYFITNNKNQGLGQGTYAHTNDLVTKDPANIKDMWGYFDSQETSGISPDMFKEFFFPYYKKLMDMCGLISYGCCEPVHSIWDNCLETVANLRKLSISPWCNEKMIAERIKDKGIIYHRKPSPNLLGATVFDEEAYAKHIRETLEAARGCKLEFSLRDIYSLGGERTRAKRVVKLIKEQIETYWR